MAWRKRGNPFDLATTQHRSAVVFHRGWSCRAVPVHRSRPLHGSPPPRNRAHAAPVRGTTAGKKEVRHSASNTVYVVPSANLTACAEPPPDAAIVTVCPVPGMIVMAPTMSSVISDPFEAIATPPLPVVAEMKTKTEARLITSCDTIEVSPLPVMRICSVTVLSSATALSDSWLPLIFTIPSRFIAGSWATVTLPETSIVILLPVVRKGHLERPHGPGDALREGECRPLPHALPVQRVARGGGHGVADQDRAAVGISLRVGAVLPPPGPAPVEPREVRRVAHAGRQRRGVDQRRVRGADPVPRTQVAAREDDQAAGAAPGQFRVVPEQRVARAGREHLDGQRRHLPAHQAVHRHVERVVVGILRYHRGGHGPCWNGWHGRSLHHDRRTREARSRPRTERDPAEGWVKRARSRARDNYSGRINVFSHFVHLLFCRVLLSVPLVSYLSHLEKLDLFNDFNALSHLS